MSKTYQAYLGQGLTRSLVAMRAEESSTRTVGVTQLQFLYGLISPDRVFDRLLSGPTSDIWIDPWTQYLQKLGVEFHPGTHRQNRNGWRKGQLRRNGWGRGDRGGFLRCGLAGRSNGFAPYR